MSARLPKPIRMLMKQNKYLFERTRLIKALRGAHTIIMKHPEMTVVARRHASFTGLCHMVPNNISTNICFSKRYKIKQSRGLPSKTRHIANTTVTIPGKVVICNELNTSRKSIRTNNGGMKEQ